MADSLMGPATGLVNSKLALADAGAENVLSGKKFYAGDKVIKTGSMPNRGDLGDKTLNPGDVISVPYGYYSSGGKFAARNITTSDALGQIHLGTLDTSVPCGGSTRYSTGGRKCIGISYISVNAGSDGTIRFCQIVDDGYTINAGCDGSAYLTIRFYYV